MLATFRYLVASAVLCFAAVSPVPAQQAPPLGDVRVALVAGATPTRGGTVEVVRRANRSPQNVVIVDRKATAEDLAGAIVMLNELRVAHGDKLTMDFRASAQSVRPGPTWQSSDYRAWLTAQLARLRAAPATQFADMGIVRAVHITLPAPRRAVGSGG